MRKPPTLWLLLAASAVVSGCSPSALCRCAPCRPDVVIEVTIEPGVLGPVIARETVCPSVDAQPRCELSLGPGAHDVTITGAGALPTTVRVMAGPRTIPGACNGQCPACSPPATFEANLRAAPIDAAMDSDAAVRDPSADASVLDASVLDASVLDASVLDASVLDAADAALACDPSRIVFRPSEGSLSEGQLCDDVFACVASTADAARLQEAAPGFECAAAPEGPCSLVTCRYPTSTLDAAEIDEICTLTTLGYVTELECRVYL